jgi:hypothetical protein
LRPASRAPRATTAPLLAVGRATRGTARRDGARSQSAGWPPRRAQSLLGRGREVTADCMGTCLREPLNLPAQPGLELGTGPAFSAPGRGRRAPLGRLRRGGGQGLCRLVPRRVLLVAGAAGRDGVCDERKGSVVVVVVVVIFDELDADLRLFGLRFEKFSAAPAIRLLLRILCGRPTPNAEITTFATGFGSADSTLCPNIFELRSFAALVPRKQILISPENHYCLSNELLKRNARDLTKSIRIDLRLHDRKTRTCQS